MRKLFTTAGALNQPQRDIGEKLLASNETHPLPEGGQKDEESPIVKSLASHFAVYRPELLTQDKV